MRNYDCPYECSDDDCFLKEVTNGIERRRHGKQ